jgi:hypothetical protein
MVRTLSALAAAMTGTAALLAYFDPSGTLLSQQRLTADELTRIARSLVADDVHIVPDKWQSVEIVATSSQLGFGTALTATSDPGEAHFYVDASGRPTRGTRWLSQTSIPDRPNAICIGVAVPGSNDLSPAQRDGIEALQTALQE